MENALRTISDQIAAASADGSPLRIRGGGSKEFQGVSYGELLDARTLNGVISYEPTELVVTVGSGTPLAELEAILAEQGQCLAFEPPHFAWSQTHASEPLATTVGGMVAAGLAGPSRANVGGVRDYVLGVKLINGLGQHLTFGGQVMKNVAGYDVSRLMVGARGTLGLLTEISLKVLPVAPAEATLHFALDQHEALEHLHRWGGEPLPLNSSCWVMAPNPGCARPGEGLIDHKPSLYVRLRGAVAAVEAACQRMLAEVPGQRMDNAQTIPDWNLCRNQQLPFFIGNSQPDAVLWRISVPQTAPVLRLPAHPLVEWHGGLRWLWAPLTFEAELQALARDVGGNAALFVNPAATAQTNGVGAANAIRSDSPTLNAISQRLKASFDPQGIFNPGLVS
jgi:glycolate oxidase FAD binding subunit